MSPGVALALALGSLAVFFIVPSLVKTSLRSLSKVAVRRLADGSGPGTRRQLERYLDSPSEFILRLQGLIQVTLVGMAVLVTVAAGAAGLGAPGLAAFAGLGVGVLFFEHFFPRYVMSVDREKLLTRLLPAWRLLEPVAEVLAWPASQLYRAAFRTRPGATRNGGGASDEEVRAFIDVGEEAGIFDEDEGELIESVVDFGDTIVREVMTPRVDIVALEAGRTVAELRDLIIETKHSRIPIYRDRADNIEGVAYLKDLLDAWRDGKEGEKAAAWMKPTLYVPETKKVASLLKEFQRTRTTFAIVVDEFGTPAGLVTAEDLIEEIVGEIREEHEELEREVLEEPDGSFLVSGKVQVYRLEELFGLEISDADFETLAGLVFATLGRVPALDEEFTYAGLRFRVVDADRRRVNKVRITRLAAPSATAGETA